jgi:branched-chain amino acid transport system permease protein
MRNFLTTLMNGILMGLVYDIMALGLTIVFGVTRFVNFAHGQMLILAGLLGIWFLNTFQLGPIPTFVCVSISMFLCCYGLQTILLNRFVRMPEHSQFIVLAAFGMILMSMQEIIFGTDAQHFTTYWSYHAFNIGGVFIDAAKFFAGVVSICFSFVLFNIFHKTRYGKSVLACADNFLGAQVIGLDYKKIYAISFGLAGLCIGTSGCLLATLVDISPSSASHLTLLCFIIVILGGLDGIGGTLIAGLAIGITESFAAYYIQGSLKSLVSLIVLVLVLLIRPHGIKVRI